jgi:hypothetical protein
VKVEAAVSELRDEYSDRVDLTVIPAEETKVRQDELERYHLKSRGHGLIAFARSGDPVVTIAGHNFGKEEILMAIGQVVEP